MNDMGMTEVELRELRYFVAVATELNFTRAAERLGMAQSPLSKAIRQLESRLGVPLLRRTTRQATLTPAGEVLLAQARLVLEASVAAVARTRRAGRAEPRLTVAMKPGGDGGLLRAIVARYRAPDLPAVDVTVAGWGGPADLLRTGAADVALLRGPFDARGIETEELLSESRVAVLAADHRLAGRARLRRGDLAGEPMPRWRGADAATTAHWTGADPSSPELRPPAAEQATGPEIADITQLFEVVALGQAVAFLPASVAARQTRPDVVTIPVTDLSPSVVAVAWPAGSRSRAVAAFVLAAVRAAAADPAAARLVSAL